MKKINIIIFMSILCILFGNIGLYINKITNKNSTQDNPILISYLAKIDDEVQISNENAVETAKKIEKIITSNRREEKEYYGGMYINEDNEVIVNVVKNEALKKSKENNSDLRSLLDISQNIRISYVDYSYNDLKKVNDTIIDYFSSEDSDYDNLVSNYIDETNNRVVVVLADNSEDKQNEFYEKVIKSECIQFKEGNRPVLAYNPGQGMSYYGEECSIGFRAKLNGKDGFVTAAHCFPSIKEGDSFAGFGTLKLRKFGGSVDNSFIETSTIMTNILQYSTYSTSSIKIVDYGLSYYVGQLIGKSGVKTQASTGRITNTSVALWLSDEAAGATKYITDLVYTDVKIARGDSGGPVFTLDNPGILLGTVEAVNLDNNNMYFVKYPNIKSSLGIVAY